MPESSKRILRHRRALSQKQPITFVGWAILALVMALLVGWFVSRPSHIIPAIAIVAALGLWIYISTVLQSRRFDRMLQARQGESICQFARHFRGPDFDPVVIRSVYEITQQEICRPDFPVRASDSFLKDYGIENEDLAYLGAEVAQLAQRSLKDTSRNPHYDHVETVADLVRFIQFQPRLPHDVLD